MKNWYTLQTNPNAEYQVTTYLVRRGIDFYLPEVDAPRSRRQRKKKPFFPGYLFIKVDFEQVELSAIRWTPGLRRIVSFDDQPLAVDDEVIDYIQSCLDRQKQQPAEHDFKPGDVVKIKDGPFAGLEAVFDSDITPAKRVQILLQILGHANRVTINVDDLEKLDSPAKSEPTSKRPRRSRGRGRPIKPKSLDAAPA